MSKKIFVWVGHPRETSLSHGMADAYSKGAQESGAEIRRMNVFDMQFDPDLTYGYHQRKDHEPCLTEFRDNILWADHLCWAYPQWWGGMPAKMKGVIDRAFLPGFAMNYHDNNAGWDKLLKGRSADILMTSDAPVWFDSFFYGRAAKNQVKRTVLWFTGVAPVHTLQVATVKGASEKAIKGWLDKAYKRGLKAGK